MSARSALVRGRRLAAAQMLDTCRITRGAGMVGTDPDSGEVMTTPNVVYEGRCKVQTWEGFQGNPEAGTAVFTTQRYMVHMPVSLSAAGYKPTVGDDVTVLTAELDPHLAGRKFQVVSLLHKTLSTAYRLGVEEGP